MAQIFISYARNDVAVAKLVKTGLQAAGYTATLDIDDFTRGDWADQITTKLDAASDVLVFVGPASLASINVGDEVKQALAYGKPLVPVLLTELLTEPPAKKPEWAVALLRNQAARYDPLDLEVSLARIVRLLSCKPLPPPVAASPVAVSMPAPELEARSSAPPQPAPDPAMHPSTSSAGSRLWPWAGVGTAALALALWFVAWYSPSERVTVASEPASAASAALSIHPGKLRILFRGEIRREQMVSLEGKMRAVGFDVARSERTEAVDGAYVVHGDARSAALAEQVRALAQAHFDALGCRLGTPLELRPLVGTASPPGDLTLSVVGRCP